MAYHNNRPIFGQHLFLFFPKYLYFKRHSLCSKYCAYYISHWVLLKHYYSVDFPWWFDRKLVSLVSSAKLGNWKKKLSNDRNSKLHFVIWQKNCFCWILSACSSGLRFHINLEAKSMHGSSWKKNSIISVFILVFAGQVLFTVNGLF